MREDIAQKALRLLYEMKNHGEESPLRVASYAGIDVKTEEYNRAVSFLEQAGFLVQHGSEPDGYVITPRGHRALAEM